MDAKLVHQKALLCCKILLFLSIATMLFLCSSVFKLYFMVYLHFSYFLGIHPTAVSVGQDSMLRQFIRKSTMVESKFLDNIGYSQTDLEIKNKVLFLAKNNLEDMQKETGITSTLNDDDLREYIEIVLREVNKNKQPNPNDL